MNLEAGAIRIRIHAGDASPDHVATVVASVCRRTVRQVVATVLVPTGTDVPEGFRAGNLEVGFQSGDRGGRAGEGDVSLGVHQLLLGGAGGWLDAAESSPEREIPNVAVHPAGRTTAGRADVEWGGRGSRTLDWSGGLMPWQDAGVCGFQLWLRELTGWDELRDELGIRERDRGRTPAYVIHRARTGVRREELLRELDDAGFAVEPVIGIDPELPVDFRASVAILLEWFGWPPARENMARALGHRLAWLDFLAKSGATHSVFCEDDARWRQDAASVAPPARQAGGSPWFLVPEGGGLRYVLSREAAAILTGLDLAVPAAFDPLRPRFGGLDPFETGGGALPSGGGSGPGAASGSTGPDGGIRFLVGVCGRADRRERRDAIRNSWMPDRAKASRTEILFVTGSGGGEPAGGDTLILPRSRDGDSREPDPGGFVRRAAAGRDFDWLLLCGDDAYLATDRLGALAAGEADMVVCGEIPGRDGGGICMLRRSVVARIARGDIPIGDGAGIGEIALAVAAHGIPSREDPRLCRRYPAAPRWDNDLAGCQHVPEGRMGVIHAMRTGVPLGLAEIRHPRWSDHVHLHPEGLCERKSSPDSGRWIRDPETGELTLAWFGAHPETFSFGPDGLWHPAPAPAGPPSPGGIPAGKVVFVHAEGRTGNQLFQYAYGLHLSLRFGCRLAGNLGLLSGMEGVPAEVAAGGSPPGRTARIRRVDDHAVARCLADPGIDGIELRGFFQTYGHFEGISARLGTILGESAKRDAIGIHVRRGDYPGSGHDMGLPASFFAAGARRLASVLGEVAKEIVVFSDDPDWCGRNLTEPLAAVLPVRIFRGGERDTLAAMKSMRGMVIVNSTFGWWGAWLAGGPAVTPVSWRVPHGNFQPALGCTRPGWVTQEADDWDGSPWEPGGFDETLAAVTALLKRLRSEAPARFVYGTHLRALADILRALRPAPGEALLEFGGGGFSTPLLLSTGGRVFTVEQGQNVPASQNAVWLERLRGTFGHLRRWRLMDFPGTESWRAAVYPAGVLFCLVDGNGNCRKEVIEFMLARGVPVVAAHDSETASYRYDQIEAPVRYSVHDFRGERVRTRIWSSHARVTAVLDGNSAYSLVGGPCRRIDLRRIPVWLVGAESSEGGLPRHRYRNHPDHAGRILPHTGSVPRTPGGNTRGCAAAHRLAVARAMACHPGVPVLLLEDDAVMSPWFDPVLEGVPGDADVVWLGCTNGSFQGRQSPCVAERSAAPYLRLHGVCQGSHAVLLATDRGKQAWEACCARAAGGESGGCVDLVCSMAGVAMCRHYVVAIPLFYQPDHPATLLPLLRESLPDSDPREGPCPISATRLIIHDHSVLAGLLHGRELKVVDLGACAGDFTDEIADIFSVGRAVLVEPHPGNFRRLGPGEGRILLNRAVVPHATQGTVPFTEDLDSPRNGSLVFADFARKATHRVETVTLAQVADLFGPSEMIDLLKIDIEGTECGVLLEAEESVLGRFVQIAVEFHDFADPSLRPLVRKVEERLCSLGFAVLKRGTRYRHGSQHYDTLFARIPGPGPVPEANPGFLRPERDILGTWDQFSNGVPVCRRTFLPGGRMADGGRWRTGRDGAVVFGSHRVRPAGGGALAGAAEDGTGLYLVRTRSSDLPGLPDADPFGILARMIAGAACLDLERYGPDRDGGYAVPAAACFDLVVTVGVGRDIGFETHYARSHPTARFELFDHTVGGLPAGLPGAVFHRVGTGRGSRLRTMPELLETCLRPSDRMVLLKMDCEGGEWDCDLEEVPFDRIHTLVIEIHGLLKPAGKARMARVLAAIDRHFTLVCAFPNNCSAQGAVHGHILTDCLELTLVNRRHAGPPATRSAGLVRHFPNHPARPPAVLETVPAAVRVPTVVSAFFDIGPFRKGGEGIRDATAYRRWMAGFARIENPLVFFAETEEDLALMAVVRKRCHHPTALIPVDRSGLRAFGRLGAVADSIRRGGFPKAHPNTTLAEYSCVQHAKYELVGRAIASGLAGAGHCCWMDCGRIFDFLALDPLLLYQLQHDAAFDRGIHYTRAKPFEPLPPAAIQAAEGGAGAFCHAGGFFYGGTGGMAEWCATYLEHALRYQDEGWVFTDQATLHAMLSEGLAGCIRAHPFPDRWFGLCDHLLRVVRLPAHRCHHD